MTKLELEAALEQRCVDKVEAAGGLALKLQIPGVRGFPDRTIFVQGHKNLGIPGHIWFAEFKRIKTGKVSAQQHRWRTLLFQLGFNTYFIDTDEQFDKAMREEGVQ